MDEVPPSPSDSLSERLALLEEKQDKLLEASRRAEGEKKYLEMEMLRLQKEIKRLKTELDRLNAPPLIIGTIRDVLADGRVIVKSSTGPDFIVNCAEYVAKENILVGARVALNKQTLAVMGVLPPSLDPIVLGAEVIAKPTVTYEDIGGLEKEVIEIREAVEDPLLKRELYKLAREKAPTIVFLDEIDSVGAKRLEVATSGDREVQRTLMQLLAELDGFNPLGEIKIIGATNRPDILDDALLRPGRFDRIIEIPLPNVDARYQILKIHTRGMNISSDVDLETLSQRTDGATGADIKSVCTEAGMFAIRLDRSIVLMEDFEKAVDKVLGDPSAKGGESGAMYA